MQIVASAAVVAIGCTVFCPMLGAQVTTTVRDSANIRIVENRLRGEPPIAFAVAETPIVSFGGASTDSLAELYSVSDAIRLPNGTFLIGTGSRTPSLRLFDAAGKHSATVARAGQGPGELRNSAISISILPGDSIAVTSPPGLLVFDLRGRWLRTETVRGNSPVVLASSVLTRGRGATGPVLRRAGRTRAGELPDTGVIIARGEQGSLIGIAIPAGDGLPPATAFVILPFRRSISAAADGAGGFIVGDGETFEIRWYDASGSLHTVIRRDADLRVRSADVDQFRATIAPEYQGARRVPIDRWINGLEMPGTKPAFSTLTIDRAGRIWAETFASGFGQPHYYSVFDRDGRLLGTVRLPAGFNPYDIGGDYILGAVPDADGFQRLQLRILTPVR